MDDWRSYSSSPSVEEVKLKEKRKRPTQYVSHACDNCKRAKVKCDGGGSCSRCTRKKIPCLYSPQKKRGCAPKKHKKDNSSSLSALDDSSNLTLQLCKNEMASSYFKYLAPNNLGVIQAKQVLEPRNLTEEFIQSVAFGLVARATEDSNMISFLEKRMGQMAASLHDNFSFNTARAFALFSQYYHGSDIQKCYHYMTLSRSICERMEAKFEGNVDALRASVNIKVLCLVGADVELDSKMVKWVSALRGDFTRIHNIESKQRGAMTMRSLEALEDVDREDAQNPIPDLLVDHITDVSEEFVAKLRFGGSGGLRIPELTPGKMEPVLMETLKMEYSMQNIPSFKSTIKMYSGCFGCFMAALMAGTKRNAEVLHYLYVALVQFKQAQHLWRWLPSALLGHIRMLFTVSLHVGKSNAAILVLKLMKQFSKTIPRMKSAFQEDYNCLMAIQRTGVLNMYLLPPPTSNEWNDFNPYIFAQQEKIPSYEELDPEVRAILERFPESCLITRELNCDYTKLDEYSPSQVWGRSPISQSSNSSGSYNNSPNRISFLSAADSSPVDPTSFSPSFLDSLMPSMSQASSPQSSAESPSLQQTMEAFLANPYEFMGLLPEQEQSSLQYTFSSPNFLSS